MGIMSYKTNSWSGPYRATENRRLDAGHVRRRSGVISGGAADVQRCKHGRSNKGNPVVCQYTVAGGNLGFIPVESREDDRSDSATVKGALAASPPVVTPSSGHCNEGCEPEDHGNKLDSANRKLVGCSGEASWCEDEICDSQEGPDGGEEHEGDARRHPGDVGIDN